MKRSCKASDSPTFPLPSFKTTKQTHTRIISPNLYLTHVHKSKSYMLSEVLPMPGGNSYTRLKTQFCASSSHSSVGSHHLFHTNPLSLFLLGSVTLVKKGKTHRESVPNRLSDETVEGPEQQVVATCRSDCRHSRGSSFRQQALRPSISNHPPQRFNEPNQADAMGMAGGKARLGQKGSGKMASFVGFPLPDLKKLHQEAQP